MCILAFQCWLFKYLCQSVRVYRYLRYHVALSRDKTSRYGFERRRCFTLVPRCVGLIDHNREGD